jgi:putative NADH-flavin reductase
VAKAFGQGVNWSILAPGAYFVPGERTGKYTKGTDYLIHDGTGTSRITYDDYAIAMVDEVEANAHNNQRWTVSYGTPGY